MRWAWRRTPTAWRTALDGVTKRAVDRTWPPFDPNAKCFAVNNGEVYGAVRVNLAGREPSGRVAPGRDYEDFCRKLGDDLLALVNADSGAPAVRRVLRTAEIYEGPRLAALPDVPTLAEQGLPSLDVGFWWGLVGPPGLSTADAAELNQHVNAILHEAETDALFTQWGIATSGGTPEAFGRLIASESSRWTEMANRMGIKSP